MIKTMKKQLVNYFSEIGRRGGKKSRRQLSPDAAREMVKLREARRAYKKYHGQCFWSFDPNYKISKEDIPWVAEQLKKNGNRELWVVGVKLCR